jgi:hypothetical protein
MTAFWVDSPESLLSLNFDSKEGILNSMTLLVVVIAIILNVYGFRDFNINMILLLLLVVITIVGSILSHQDNFINVKSPNSGLSSRFEPVELEEELPCRPPTENNPFGNPLLTDFDVKQEYSSACSSDKANTIRNETLNDGIFMNSNNYFWKRASQNNFYTVAGSSVPNDQMAFANWCYNDNNNCKSGNIFMKNPELAAESLKTCKPLISGPEQLAMMEANIHDKGDVATATGGGFVGFQLDS